MKRLLLIITTLHLFTIAMLNTHLNITTLQTEQILPSNIIRINYVINSYQNNIETFHGYYSQPVFPDTFQNSKALNHFYQDKWYNDYKEIKELRDDSLRNILPDSVYAYDHTFEVTFLSPHFLSILENTYTFAGGVHPENITKAHTFSIQTGKELNLKNLFLLSDKDIDKLIKNLIIDKIQKNPEEYFPDAIRTIQKYSLEDFHFYINKDGIVIFFNPYEIAPYTRGVVEFNIPL